MPLLLHLSKLLLLSPRVRSEGQPLLVKPAALRCLFIQQQLLESRSSSLWVEVEDLVKGLDTALGDEIGLPRQVLVGRYHFIFMGIFYSETCRVSSIWNWDTFPFTTCSMKRPRYRLDGFGDKGG